MQVEVRGSIDKALFLLKRKMRADGVFAALERHRAYAKPSAARKQKRAANRRRLARSKQRQQIAEARRS